VSDETKDRNLQIDGIELEKLLFCTRVNEVQVDVATVMKLADVDLFSGKSRRAFIAPNPLAYGLSRMFIAARQLAGEEQMRVFKESAMKPCGG
jgi:hypothetical protein